MSEKIQQSDTNFVDKPDNVLKNRSGNSRMLVDLLRLIPNYSDKKSFRKKKQLIKNELTISRF